MSLPLADHSDSVGREHLDPGWHTLNTIGIEEPESTLHPAAAGVLLDALRHAGERGQAVITSHSPDLLDRDDFRPEELCTVRSVGRETRIGPLEGERGMILDRNRAQRRKQYADLLNERYRARLADRGPVRSDPGVGEDLLADASFSDAEDMVAAMVERAGLDTPVEVEAAARRMVALYSWLFDHAAAEGLQLTRPGTSSPPASRRLRTYWAFGRPGWVSSTARNRPCPSVSCGRRRSG